MRIDWTKLCESLNGIAQDDPLLVTRLMLALQRIGLTRICYDWTPDGGRFRRI